MKFGFNRVKIDSKILKNFLYNKINFRINDSSNETAPVPQPVVDESLAELNSQLSKELKQLQGQLELSGAQLVEHEAAHTALQHDMQQLKEKSAFMQRDSHVKFQEQLAELTQAKEKEITFLQLEMKKLLDENEKVIKVKLIKRLLHNLIK